MWKKSTEIENELEQGYQKEAIGAQIRAMVKWVEEGKKLSISLI